jgi:hypothetical protein
MLDSLGCEREVLLNVCINYWNEELTPASERFFLT